MNLERDDVIWLSDAAEALGEVRESDGAPKALTWSEVLECIRDLRERAMVAEAKLRDLDGVTASEVRRLRNQDLAIDRFIRSIQESGKNVGLVAAIVAPLPATTVTEFRRAKYPDVAEVDLPSPAETGIFSVAEIASHIGEQAKSGGKE